jgi:alkylation response protein AidB-like acyl-CoA dehydrogenase
MQLEWTEEQRLFRAELRQFVEARRRPDWTHYQREMPEPADRESAIEFCRALAGAGLLTPHWPREYGGREASPWEQTIVSEELWGAGEPRASQYYNVNWIGPAIMAAGTAEQKAEHLGSMGRGEAMWCQGFSEPDAGSDLASLRTTAIRDGDVYLVNGQKIWTSYAHAADFIFLLARTDPDSKGTEGISVLLAPMDLPGVEVRNIPNPWVAHMIHEVWFTDVQVPVSCRLGEENQGWSLVRSVLANERIGLARHECAERTVDAVLDHATAAGLDVDDPGLQEAVGLAYACCEAARAVNYAAVNERTVGRDERRPLASLSRAVTVFAEQQATSACFDVLGSEAFGHDSVAEHQLDMSTVAGIAAGSLDVQLNLISRNLGLPKPS